MLRRSPRKHSSRAHTTLPESTVLTPHNPELEEWPLPRRSPRKHSSTRDALKPLSSLFKDAGCVVQSYASKVRSTDVVTQGARTPGGYSKLTITGSAIVPSGGQGLTYNVASSSHLDSFGRFYGIIIKSYILILDT